MVSSGKTWSSRCARPARKANWQGDCRDPADGILTSIPYGGFSVQQALLRELGLASWVRPSIPFLKSTGLATTRIRVWAWPESRPPHELCHDCGGLHEARPRIQSRLASARAMPTWISGPEPVSRPGVPAMSIASGLQECRPLGQDVTDSHPLPEAAVVHLDGPGDPANTMCFHQIHRPLPEIHRHLAYLGPGCTPGPDRRLQLFLFRLRRQGPAVPHAHNYFHETNKGNGN